MFPIYGGLYVKLLFATLALPITHNMDDVKSWTLWIIYLSIFSFTVTYIYKVLFGVLGENMTLKM